MSEVEIRVQEATQHILQQVHGIVQEKRIQEDNALKVQVRGLLPTWYVVDDTRAKNFCKSRGPLHPITFLKYRTEFIHIPYTKHAMTSFESNQDCL